MSINRCLCRDCIRLYRVPFRKPTLWTKGRHARGAFSCADAVPYYCQPTGPSGCSPGTVLNDHPLHAGPLCNDNTPHLVVCYRIRNGPDVPGKRDWDHPYGCHLCFLGLVARNSCPDFRPADRYHLRGLDNGSFPSFIAPGWRNKIRKAISGLATFSASKPYMGFLPYHCSCGNGYSRHCGSVTWTLGVAFSRHLAGETPPLLDPGASGIFPVLAHQRFSILASGRPTNGNTGWACVSPLANEEGNSLPGVLCQ